MSATLARYLKDFSAPPPVPLKVDSLDEPGIFDGDAPLGLPPVEHSFDTLDIEHEKELAFSEGYEKASEELTQKHQADLMAQAQVFQQQLEAIRAENEVQAATRIDQRLTDMHAALVRILSEKVVEALVPVLGHFLAEKAVSELADMLRAQFEENGSLAVVVRGPAALFDILQARLGENAPALRYIQNNALDLQIEFDETVLVTRLSAWAEATGKLQR